MQITAPSGRTYQWNKPTEPTKEDYDALQRYDDSLSNAKPEQSGLGQTAADIGIEVGLGIGGQVAGAALAPLTAGASIPVLGGIGAGIGNTLVQKGQIQRGERPDFSFGELASAIGLGAIPGGKAAQAGGSVLKNMGMRAAQGAGLAGAGEIARVAIDQGRLPTAEEFTTALAGGSITGGALGGLEQSITTRLKTNPLFREQRIGSEIIDALKRIDGEKNAISEEGRVLISELDKKLKGIKDPVVRADLDFKVNQVLGGKLNQTNIPEDFAAITTALRKTTDDATGRLKDLGIIEKDEALYSTLTNNEGSYLRRAYKIFAVPGWRPSKESFNKWVTQNVENDMSNWTGLKTNKLLSIKDANDQIAAERAKLTQKYTNKANELLDRDNATAYLTQGRVSTNTGIFRKRKNIDQATRELLGEIQDPVFVASDTLGRMTGTEATYKGLSEVRRIGLDSGIFRQNKSIEGDVMIAPKGDKFNPLSGLWTSPEFRDEFDKYNANDLGPIMSKMSGLAIVSSAAKIPKTLFSLKGWASNAWGGPLDVIAQGHGLELLKKDNYNQALKNAGYQIGFIKPDGSVSAKEAQEFYKGMLRYNLIEPNVQFSDFLSTFEIAEGQFKNPLLVKTASKAKSGLGTIGKFYSMPATSSKVFNLAGELQDMRAAFPDESPDVIFRKAAERTRMTTEGYSNLPKAIRNFSSVGFLDPFVAYTADRFRVVYNTYKLALEDMNSGNDVLRKAGAKRMAAMTTTLAAAGALGLNTDISKEEEAAVRNRLPEWDKDAFIKINKKDDGSYTYANLNYNIPHTIVMEAAFAALNQENPQDAMKKFISVASKQAFGQNLLLAPLTEVYTGKTGRGVPISSENDPDYKQFIDKSAYFINEAFTPLVLKEINKGYNALKAEQSSIKPLSPNAPKIEDILLSNLAGIRIQRVNPREQMKFQAAGFSRDLVNDQIAFSSEKRRALDEGEVAKAFDRFSGRYKSTYDKVTGVVSDARVLGLTDDEIARTLKDGRVPTAIALGAINGTYVEPEPDNENSPKMLYEKIQALPKGDQERALRQLISQKPDIGKSLVSRFRQDVRNEALNIGEMDKLLLAQSAEDGERAMFINRKLATIQEDYKKQIYLNDLRKKKILTPQVEVQMIAYR
jgi:hypothetical protein